MKHKTEYRKIQGVNPVPSMRSFASIKGPVPRQQFFDILVTPNHGGDAHLIFTLRAHDATNAGVIAKQRLMTGGKWRFFDLSTITATEAK